MGALRGRAMICSSQPGDPAGAICLVVTAGGETGVSMQSPEPRRFAVALSFPGEHRDVVKQVADQLAAALTRERVLYDKYHAAEFARPGLNVYLPNLYRTQSELIVIFLCPEYQKKRWCRLEWRFINQLIATV
jgi:hypothetical protein